MKKIILLAVAVLMAVSMLVACGPAPASEAPKSEAPAQDAPASEAPASEAPANAGSGETVEISFLDPMPGPARSEAFKSVIAKFEAENPNIKVRYESVAWDDARQKLVTLASSKSLPDVIQMHEMWYGEFILPGWVTDLTPYYEKSPLKEDFNDITKSFLIESKQVVPYKGIYGIPEGVTAMGIYVRTDWMKEAGLNFDENWTWDNFFEYVEKVTDPAKNRYGNAFRGGQWGLTATGIYNIYQKSNGKFFNEDGSSVLLDDYAPELFEEFYDIYKEGYAPKDSINWGYPEMVQGFTSGMCGTLFQTTEVIQSCLDTLEEGTYAVYPVPQAEDGYVYNEYSSSTNYGIAENSQYKDEAWKFIEFCSRPDINIEIAKANYLIPVVKQAADDSYFGEGVWKGYTTMINKPNYAVKSGLGFYPEVGEINGDLSTAEVQKYCLGQQDAKTTLDNIGNAVTEAQKAYMEANPDIPVPMPFYPNK